MLPSNVLDWIWAQQDHVPSNVKDLSSILGLSANFKFLSTRNFFIKLWLCHSLVSYVEVKENMYDIIYFVFLKFVLNLFFVFQIYKVTAFTLFFFFQKYCHSIILMLNLIHTIFVLTC